jgi:poly(A) polymerase
VWLPEVDALSGVEQYAKYHPEGDVWQHTLLMFRNLDAPASAPLAWSILLHDIGKKPTFSCGSDGIPHFYCHESVGADMVEVIAQRLRFPVAMAETVTHAVRNHMRFAHVKSMRQAKLKRLLAEKDFFLELELHRLDCLSSNGLMETFEFLKEATENSSSVQLPPLLLNGNDLIKLGYKPGKAFKLMLDALMDAQLENCVTDREQAVKFISEKFPQI